MARAAIVACAMVLFGGCSPYGGGDFACTTDSECGGNGTCSDGFCSFPDPDCMSGFRFGEHSGPNSGDCVGAQQQDDGGVNIDTPPGQFCYGTGLVKPCFASAPTNTQTFAANTVINTDTDQICATTLSPTGACVVAAQSITINGGIYVAGIGTKPLVFVADQSITVTGRIDVSSYRQFMSVGAAADAPGCNAGTAPTATSGGAGGSFGGLGGAGAAVGTAGMPGTVLTPTMLRGGCPGQTGADNVAPMGPGTGGHGGGAVYLIANTSIMVGATGVIDASGEGGAGGQNSTSGGGGGGGSGGYIGFDTPSLMVSGSVFANGGGGGEASGATTTGVNGADPSLPTNAALGGAGGSNFGTDGGNGSVGANLNGQPGASACTGTCTTPGAGGGGGGGAGIIKLYRATSTGGGQVSPPTT